MNKPNIIEIKDVFFTYGCHPVLDNINLNIAHGDAVGLVGPNGSGKTTLLKIILGQIKPDSGTVKVFGTEAHRLRERYRIGYVSQRATHFNMEFPATVKEVVTSGRVPRRGLFRILTKQDRLAVEQALNLVGLGELGDQPIGILSGGQQQRVLVARAMVAEPEILIMDEPTVGIDETSQAAFFELLRKLNRQKTTLLIVSHELQSLSTVISRQVCLDRQLCTCSCHTYPTTKLQVKHCNKRLSLQYAK